MDATFQIRELNDAFRTQLVGGRVFVTAGVAAKSLDVQTKVMQMVIEFSAFTPENDPYGEHDFGAFEHAGEQFFWKIDCYDREMNSGSPDPANSAVTTRVLTVMLADEY